jgi:hypothetical protein
VTSPSQGLSSNKREEPGNEVGRTVLSNTKGKTKLGNDFQAYCAIDVEETERRILYNLLQKLQVKAGNVDKEDK